MHFPNHLSLVVHTRNSNPVASPPAGKPGPVTAWVNEMSAVLAALDPNHMVPPQPYSPGLCFVLSSWAYQMALPSFPPFPAQLIPTHICTCLHLMWHIHETAVAELEHMYFYNAITMPFTMYFYNAIYNTSGVCPNAMKRLGI